MRVVLTVALVVALAFAGCSDKKKGGSHEEDTYECPDGTVLDLEEFPDHHEDGFDPAEHCPEEDDGNNTATPNVPPVLVVKVYDAPGGNETNVTLVGGSLTFSAEGSSDEGTLSGIAVTVDDGNSTRTQPLYGAGQFAPATFTFDRAGIVNVTVAGVDDRAGFTVAELNVYVNEIFTKTSHQYTTAAPAQASDPTECAGVDGATAVTNTFSEGIGFGVTGNASYVEVVRTMTGTVGENGQIDYAICTPEGIAIGGPFDNSEPQRSTNTERLPASVNYYVWSVGRVPGSQADFTITVHYEPLGTA